MLVTADKILEYIPQRPPIAMVDELIHCDRTTTVSSFLVRETNIFFEDGFLSESALVENIAQTAAAGVGYVCKQENKPVPIGFIAAIKDLKVFRLPQANQKLDTEVILVNEVMDVSIVQGTVKQAGELLASCEMRIFIKVEEN